MEINKYVKVNPDGSEEDFEYDTMDEAVDSSDGTQAVIERTYTFDDSELVWTPNGEDTWPMG